MVTRGTTREEISERFGKLQHFVETMRYKPRTQITLDRTLPDHVNDVPVMWVLRVVVFVPDVERPSENTMVFRTCALPPIMQRSLSDDEARMIVLQEVRGMLHDIELHEIDEWFTVAGKRIHEPEHSTW